MRFLTYIVKLAIDSWNDFNLIEIKFQSGEDGSENNNCFEGHNSFFIKHNLHRLYSK